MSENFPNLPAAIDAWIAIDPTNHSKASLSRDLRVSRATVTRWHKGEEPEVSRIREIARKLGVTVGYLADDAEFAQNEREMRVLVGLRQQPEPIQAAVEQLCATNVMPALPPPPKPE